MTNTSGEGAFFHQHDADEELTRLSEQLTLQTLHTDQGPSTQVHVDKADADGRIIQYRLDRDGVTAWGIFNTRSGQADLDVIDASGELLLHAVDLDVERYGLGSFEDTRVAARSLARVVGMGLAWSRVSEAYPELADEQTTAA